MLNRLPAAAAGAALAALVGGGLTYAMADDSDRGSTTTAAGTRTVTKSIARSGVLVEEDFDLNYSIIGGFAKCPRGTHLTGGGFDDLTDGVPFHSTSSYDGRERWFGFTIASYGQNPRDFVVTATCIGPAGKFPAGAYRTTADGAIPPSAPIPADMLAEAKQRALR